MPETVTLIHLPLMTHAHDKLGSGIPYQPVLLASLAAVLQGDYQVQVIDGFGENPWQVTIDGDFLAQGLTLEEIVSRLNPQARAVVVYVSTIMANRFLHRLLRVVKAAYPSLALIVMENSQGVIGCSLAWMKTELMASGADYIVLGDAEVRIPTVLRTLDSAAAPLADGVIYRDTTGAVQMIPKLREPAALDQLPFPAWQYFPLKNYWRLGYAHGPMEGPYLALLTSRGCPFQCNFCVAPATNHGVWRMRSPGNVVAEIAAMVKTFGVHEFHWEDLNPTASEARILEICNLIIQQKLDIRWKLASGSKIETLQVETLKRMRQAGCRYISFSPESGSPAVLRRMNKPFDHGHALVMTRRMRQLGIRSQACFVIGYPGETAEDLVLTGRYLRQLVRAGLDEAAVFMMTPIPGTKTFPEMSGYSDYAELTFAPTWRKDYPYLRRIRSKLYRMFLLGKCFWHPLQCGWMMLHLLRRRFQSKMEMNLYRIAKLNYWQITQRGRHAHKKP